jgi:hypothetical protein
MDETGKLDAKTADDKLYDALEQRTVNFETDEGELLWHYTTWEGLKGIFTKQELWASNARCLNDHGELEVAREILRSHLADSPHDHLKTNLDGIFDRMKLPDAAPYIACLSAAFDSLGQWRGYATTAPSFAVGFNRVKLEKLVEMTSGFEVRKCAYSDEGHRIAVRAYLDPLDKLYRDLERQNEGKDPRARNVWMGFGRVHSKAQGRTYLVQRLAAQIKHRRFQPELEYRLIGHWQSHLVKMDWFTRGALVVPFLRLPIVRLGNGDRVGLPIEAVLVGATPHPEMTVNVVQMMVEQLRVLLAPMQQLINVTNSRIPFRNW